MHLNPNPLASCRSQSWLTRPLLSLSLLKPALPQALQSHNNATPHLNHTLTNSICSSAQFPSRPRSSSTSTSHISCSGRPSTSNIQQANRALSSNGRRLHQMRGLQSQARPRFMSPQSRRRRVLQSLRDRALRPCARVSAYHVGNSGTCPSHSHPSSLQVR
jgi:hypothetical protein